VATERCAVDHCINSSSPGPATVHSSAASSALGLTNTEETGVECYGTVGAVGAISYYPWRCDRLVVSKRRQGITTTRCVITQKSVVLRTQLLDSLALRMGPTDCPETSRRNYHYSLCNNPEERICRLLCGGNLKRRRPNSRRRRKARKCVHPGQPDSKSQHSRLCSRHEGV
jgi:hypothetical protein